MSSTPVKGRSPLKKAAFAALAACAAFVFIVPHSQAQTAEQTALQTALLALPGAKATITINNATALQLETAVSNVIKAGNSGFTAAQLATAALEPITVKGKAVVRLDRSTVSGPGVVTAAISALVSSTDATFAADAAAVVDDVATVNVPTTAQELSLGGQEAVVKAAIAAISDFDQNGSPLTSAALLAADKSIGNALATDGTLIGLLHNGLTTILDTAIVGITGAKAKSTAAAPYAAESFVAGILQSGVVPNGATLTAFEESMLSKPAVSANTSVDELVTYEVALKEPAASDLTSLGTSLYTKFPLAKAKVTQGILASVDPVAVSGSAAEGDDVTGRVSVADALTTAAPADASKIAQGGVFVDPLHAPQFVSGVFDGIVASSNTKGAKLLITDAPGIATAVGNVLGQDGDALTNVASTYCTYISTGALPDTSAATYATDLINGAIKGTIPASQFSSIAPIVGANVAGGTLVINSTALGGTVKNPVTPIETVTDLEAIQDQFADAIVTKNSTELLTQSGAETVAGLIGTLAKDIALITKDAYYTDASSAKIPVAQVLAGSLAEFIADEITGPPFTFHQGGKLVTETAEQIVTGALQSDLDAAFAGVAAIKTAVNDAIAVGGSGDYKYVGAVTVEETAVTNL